MQFKKSAAFALMLIISLLLWLIFGDVLINPGSYLFGSVEDGIKNYYTAAFYGKYDSGLWFSGMNYPYGEHIIYTDNQPFFAVLLNLIHRHITPLADHIIAIYNVQMLLSFVLCGLFLYLILIRQLLPSWYALLTGIIIAFLSPQAFRLINHYALSYTCIIPLCWYLLIRIFEAERKLKWVLIYGFTTLVISFIHPYYTLLNLFFLIAYLLIYYLQNKKQGSRKAGFYLYIFLAATLPLLFLQ